MFSFVLMSFFLYYSSFRSFIWLLIIESVLLLVLLKKSTTSGKSIFLCLLLVLGACEVGLILSLMVSVARFVGMEATKNLLCEGY